MSTRLCAPVPALLTAAGCIAAGDRASESGVRTEVIDGVEHVVNVGGGAWGEDERWRLVDEEAVEVRVLSPAGEFLFRYGRAGEGPGEFRNISGTGRDGAGGVAVLDGSLGRVSRFDAEGEYRESFRLERAYMIHGYNAPVRFDVEGRFHDRSS